MAESRGPDEVRDLLSGYFDAARLIIDRHGGVVEKFIGDAVMAVWGATAAREDDAERAVRAALEIVTAVQAYGEEAGVPALRARAGVVTGQVAGWSTAGDGLVVGDRVNVAARVQSQAAAGSVLVDDVTRRATEAAISYVDAGDHELKGKAEPMRLWQACRVVAAVGGAQRVDGMEADFLGRARDLLLVKELFHSVVEESRARLVAVSGTAGVGKSRLAWEFQKYVDGLADTVLWHSGRCLSYGDGVAYWALVQMVRQRLGIAEEDDEHTVAAKLADGLEQWVPDEAERAFVGPRLGALVGTSDAELSREELFAGWRLFLERLAAHTPVVMVIEDLQWADAGLLEFLEYLLDWSAALPIFVLTFARPEIADRRADWPPQRRNVTALHLDPLPDAVMAHLLEALVPGMPDSVKTRIVQHAAGIPLYAVEILRALVDRDLVIPRGGVYRLVGDVGEIDTPAGLTALIASRLDGLPPDERTLVQGLAVLGATFPREGVSAVSEEPADRLEELLRSLTRKEILTVQSDPLSPERGQYAFAQPMLRTVAYDTLPRRLRKVRHLAVAAHLRSVFPREGEDIAEVIAAHYFDAYSAAGSDSDAEDVQAEARDAYERAAQRARTIGAPDSAERCYRIAAELTGSDVERARLHEAAADAAFVAGRPADTLALLERITSTGGSPHTEPRLVAKRARALGLTGRSQEAIVLLRAALERQHDSISGQDAVELHTALGGELFFAGEPEAALEHSENALSLAAALDLPQTLPTPLGLKGLILNRHGRFLEAVAALRLAAEVAGEHGRTREAAIAKGNLGELLLSDDRSEAASEIVGAIELDRRLGDRHGEAMDTHTLAVRHILAGRWDMAVQVIDEALAVTPEGNSKATVAALLSTLQQISGQTAASMEAARQVVVLRDSDDVQDRVVAAIADASAALSRGDAAEALELARGAAVAAIDFMGMRSSHTRSAWPLAMEAALAAGRLDQASDILQLVADAPPGHLPPYLRAQLARLRSLLSAAHGDVDDVEIGLRTALESFRDLGYPYWTARTELDLASWLAAQGRATEAEPILTQASQAFEVLAAAPALEEAHKLRVRIADSRLARAGS